MVLSKNEKCMVALLAITVLAGVLDATLQAFGQHLRPDYFADILLLAAIFLLALHARWQLGLRREITFFLLAGITGLLFEVWGVKDGIFFGSHYVYNGSELKLWGVPYFIPLYWIIFIYTAYSITNSFLAWVGLGKPRKGHTRLITLVPIVIADGLFNVSLDLIVDPVKVREGSWTWLKHGAYFGIPIGNFVGWFIVTILVTGLFRLYEYFYPARITVDTALLLIPVVGYGLLGVGLIMSAAIYGMYAVASIGACSIIPITALNLTLYQRRRRGVAAETQ